MGAAFVSLLVCFMVGTFFFIFRDFNQDVEVGNMTLTQIKTISVSQKLLIDAWVEENQIQIPADSNRYRYAMHAYPDKPWVR